MDNLSQQGQQQPMNGGNNMQGNQSQGQKQDYVDKAFGFAAKKSGHNVDRNTEEKITDAGRGVYEKVTGKQVNPKVSN